MKNPFLTILLAIAFSVILASTSHAQDPVPTPCPLKIEGTVTWPKSDGKRVVISIGTFGRKIGPISLIPFVDENNIITYTIVAWDLDLDNCVAVVSQPFTMPLNPPQVVDLRIEDNMMMMANAKEISPLGSCTAGAISNEVADPETLAIYYAVYGDGSYPKTNAELRSESTFLPVKARVQPPLPSTPIMDEADENLFVVGGRVKVKF